jgi:hypothetical protein
MLQVSIQETPNVALHQTSLIRQNRSSTDSPVRFAPGLLTRPPSNPLLRAALARRDASNLPGVAKRTPGLDAENEDYPGGVAEGAQTPPG